MTARKFSLLLLAALFIAGTATVTRAQSSQDNTAPERQAAPLGGILDTYITIARGGGLIGSDHNRTFGSPQHGIWTHLGGNEFASSLDSRPGGTGAGSRSFRPNRLPINCCPVGYFPDWAT